MRVPGDRPRHRKHHHGADEGRRVPARSSSSFERRRDHAPAPARHPASIRTCPARAAPGARASTQRSGAANANWAANRERDAPPPRPARRGAEARWGGPGRSPGGRDGAHDLPDVLDPCEAGGVEDVRARRLIGAAWSRVIVSARSSRRWRWFSGARGEDGVPSRGAASAAASNARPGMLEAVERTLGGDRCASSIEQPARPVVTAARSTVSATSAGSSAEPVLEVGRHRDSDGPGDHLRVRERLVARDTR